MMRELHIARSFKIDFKKLSKTDKEDTRSIVQKLQNDELHILSLVRINSHTNIFDKNKK